MKMIGAKRDRGLLMEMLASNAEKWQWQTRYLNVCALKKMVSRDMVFEYAICHECLEVDTIYFCSLCLTMLCDADWNRADVVTWSVVLTANECHYVERMWSCAKCAFSATCVRAMIALMNIAGVCRVDTWESKMIAFFSRKEDGRLGMPCQRIYFFVMQVGRGESLPVLKQQ
jgi:hypothetical protein